jgi:hypothetical protein
MLSRVQELGLSAKSAGFDSERGGRGMDLGAEEEVAAVDWNGVERDHLAAVGEDLLAVAQGVASRLRLVPLRTRSADRVWMPDP